MSVNLIFGIHPTEAMIRENPENILSAWVNNSHDKRLDNIISSLERFGVKIQYVPKKSLDNISEHENHQGVILKIKESKVKTEEDLYELVKTTENCLLLILDDITDPHNMGACFRNADATGVSAIVAPRDKSVGITGTVRKVACGAVESVPFFQVTNLARTLKSLKDLNVFIVGTAGEAEKLVYDVDLKGSVGLVMGSEDKGMRRLTRENCDALVKLPMIGKISSLNVSVASGIFLYESLRQRLGK